MAKESQIRRESLYCPICGAYSGGRMGAFQCPECGLDLICPEHRDNQLKVCLECSNFIRSEAFERVLKKLIEETPPGMVFISPGNFTMGRDDGESHCKPSHTVRMSAYYIDERPVTHAEYKRFKPEHEIPEGKENEAVVGVSWIDAKSYAEWSGKRLPSEMEWEKAIRGVDCSLFPWGRTIPDSGGMSAEEFSKKIRQISVSQFGIKDGVGGIKEWVEDWFQPYPENIEHDQAYGNTYKVLKGGNWTSFKPLSPADRRRSLPDERPPDAGFRCAKDTSIVLDYDIHEEREKEQRRIYALLEELKREKSLRDAAKEQREYAWRTRRIGEIQEELDKIEEVRSSRTLPSVEKPIPKKFTYVFYNAWDFFGKSLTSRQNTVFQVVKILIVLIALVLFFSNYFITEKMVFTVEEGPQTYIATIDSRGKSLTILRDLGQAETSVFSPNGRYIAFVTSRDDNSEIYVATKTGKKLKNISDHPGRDFHPRFHTDGRVMWLSDRNGEPTIFAAKVDGSDLKQVTATRAAIDWFDISPSGRTIALSLKYKGKWEIYTMKMDGADFTRIGNEGFNCRNPIFGNRNNRILFSSDRDGNYELYYMSIDGSRISRVTYTIEDEIGGISFSQNGRWIVYSKELKEDGIPKNRIYRMRWNGTGKRVIDIGERNVSNPSTALAGFKRYLAHLSRPKYVPRAPRFRNHLVKKDESPREFMVRAKTRWLKTGIIVSKGDLIDLEANGFWRNKGRSDDSWSGPDGGMPGKSQGSPLTEKSPDMLIAKIGDSPPFPVGSRQSFISEWQGELRFMMNDSRKLSDNEGLVTVNANLSSNDTITVKPQQTFSLLKFFGFDDLMRSGMQIEKYFGSTRMNMVFLSLDKLEDPTATIRNEASKVRAVVLEPSSLYFTPPKDLGKVLTSFKESFGEGGIPPFGFYIPKSLPSVSQATETEIILALKKYFPDKLLLKGFTSEELSDPNLVVPVLKLYDCFIIDIPRSINAHDSETPTYEVASEFEKPISNARIKLPEKPLIITIPVDFADRRKPLTADQIEFIVRYCDFRPNIIGVIIKGTDADEEQKIRISQLAEEIVNRKPLVKGPREKVALAELLNVVIGGTPPYIGDFRGLALADDNIFLTADRNTGEILKIAQDGRIIEKSKKELPTGEMLDDITNLYIDRNDRVILLDGHPGYVVFFDEYLDFADVFKLPGEEPGGIAGITALVRDKSDNIYITSQDGELVQKLDKNFKLMRWAGGISPDPGYFLSIQDLAVGPTDSVYVIDRAKPYIQEFTSELELKSLIPLPLRESFFNPVPLFITVDDVGSIYVAEKRTRNVYRYSPSGDLVSYFELPGVPSGGIIVTSNGRFFTIVNGKIIGYNLKVKVAPANVTTPSS